MAPLSRRRPQARQFSFARVEIGNDGMDLTLFSRGAGNNPELATDDWELCRFQQFDRALANGPPTVCVRLDEDNVPGAHEHLFREERCKDVPALAAMIFGDKLRNGCIGQKNNAPNCRNSFHEFPHTYIMQVPQNKHRSSGPGGQRRAGIPNNHVPVGVDILSLVSDFDFHSVSAFTKQSNAVQVLPKLFPSIRHLRFRFPRPEAFLSSRFQRVQQLTESELAEWKKG